MNNPSSVSLQSAKLNFSARSQNWGMAFRIAMGLVIAALVALVLVAAEFRFSSGPSLSEVEAAAGTPAGAQPPSR
jgi:hypothetical protein